MDHVLYPTLKDTGFTTEVYHINGKGEDAGVVYSEMQGVENESSTRMFGELQKTLFPEGSGYRSETGGLMDALRVLDIEKIRKYHNSYYLPQNLCLFITGKIDPTKLLKVLTDEVEPTIEKNQQAKGPRPEGWKRPWVETASKTPPVLTEDKVVITEFPEKDESQYIKVVQGAQYVGKANKVSRRHGRSDYELDRRVLPRLPHGESSGHTCLVSQRFRNISITEAAYRDQRSMGNWSRP